MANFTPMNLDGLPDMAPNCSWTRSWINGHKPDTEHTTNWFNNTVIELLIGAVIIAIYRAVTNRESIQKRLHAFEKSDYRCFRPLVWMLQWYFGAALLLIVLFGRNLTEVLYITLEPVPDDPDGLSTAKKLLALHKGQPAWWWAMYASWGGPMFAGNLGLLLVIFHLATFIRSGARKKKEGRLAGNTKFKYHWQSTPVMEMVMVTMTLPLILILMASKSTIRVWLKLAAGESGAAACYDEVWYSINLQVASIFGYFVIFVFSTLINTIIKSHVTDAGVRWAVSWTSYQGTWAFVLVGIVQGALEVAYGYCILNQENIGSSKNLALVMQLRAKAKEFSTVFMILCIYNMIILCKVEEVRKALGNASLKFLATRMILIIIQYQPIILTFLSEPAFFLHSFQKVDDKMTKIGKIDEFLNWLEHFKVDFMGPDHKTREATAKLYNVCALCWEGLAVVIFNLIVWNIDPEDKIRQKTIEEIPWVARGGIENDIETVAKYDSDIKGSLVKPLTAT